MQNIIEVMAINSSTWLDTDASSTLGQLFIGGYKDFNVTVQLSGNHGLVYNMYTAPTQETNMLMSQTGGSLTSGVHSANTHHFSDNNMNWLVIKASASSVNSASLINVVLTSIIHGNR